MRCVRVGYICIAVFPLDMFLKGGSEQGWDQGFDSLAAALR
jgi:hypothetical protein